jgi:hypothetical protein
MEYTHFLGDVDAKGRLIEIGTGSAMEPEPGDDFRLAAISCTILMTRAR